MNCLYDDAVLLVQIANMYGRSNAKNQIRTPQSEDFGVQVFRTKTEKVIRCFALTSTYEKNLF